MNVIFLRRYLILLLFVAFSWTSPAAAQEATTTTTTTTAPEKVVISTVDSGQTRQQLHEVLQRLPPQVGKTLKLDPTLWTNPAYLANFPELGAFIKAHPEVPHSPDFYLESIWIPGDPTPETAGLRMWNQLFETITIFFGFGLFAGVFLWLIKTIIDHRRWNRLSRMQAEVHNKLLDRFGNNEDLLKYINTPAGRHFLESAPISLETSPRAISAPIGRVLWSVQVGIVLFAAGVGLKLVSWGLKEEPAQAMSAMGILGMAIGAGFVIAAGVSFILSRRLGLWQAPEAGATAGE